MKRFNYFVMSLISAAAFTFTACSSSDDLNGGGSGEAKVEGFYMTLTVQAPTSTGSRTVQENEYKATEAESAITSGTFYLVEPSGKIAYTKNITEEEFKNIKFQDKATGKTTLKVPVQDVNEGVLYTVYFLANTTNAKPWEDVLTANTLFARPYADANKFVMFNENDKNVNGKGYTVSFTAANKNTATPASVTGGVIKLERITARIDQPKTEATKIVANIVSEGENATPKDEEQAMLDAEAKVSGVTLTGYAISSVAKKTYIMQHWTENKTTNIWELNIPATDYFQPKGNFGTETKLAGTFTPINVENPNKDYVFENYATAEDATSMYFEYTVTLNADEIKTQTGFDADAKDGTFYRYNGIIYNSFNAIYKAYKDEGIDIMFGGKTAAQMVGLLYDEAGKVKLTEDELDTFRKDYTIEVFKGGKTYYKQAIKDNNIGYEYAIQRNTVYQLNVTNIYNLGADVPNSKKDQKPLYYLNVEVSVNPWVLNTQGVELQ